MPGLCHMASAEKVLRTTIFISSREKQRGVERKILQLIYKYGNHDMEDSDSHKLAKESPVHIGDIMTHS